MPNIFPQKSHFFSTLMAMATFVKFNGYIVVYKVKFFAFGVLLVAIGVMILKCKGLLVEANAAIVAARGAIIGSKGVASRVNICHFSIKQLPKSLKLLVSFIYPNLEGLKKDLQGLFLLLLWQSLPTSNEATKKMLVKNTNIGKKTTTKVAS